MIDLSGMDPKIKYSGISHDDMNRLQEIINHDLVLDATIMGGDKDYTVVLALANRGSLFGRGTTLHAALKDVFAKFEKEVNLHRN